MKFWVLFSIAIDIEAWVDQAWEQAGENGCRNLMFSRQFNDWELSDVEGLFTRLQEHEVREGVEDFLVWPVAKESTFSFKSFYSFSVGCHSKRFL